MSDQRHFRTSSRPRAAITVAIYRSEIAGKKDNKINAFTNDIGTGGLLALTGESFAVGERVELELPTPSTWAPLRFKAEVVRVQGADGELQGVGLRFVDITDEQAVVLSEFIASLDFDA